MPPTPRILVSGALALALLASCGRSPDEEAADTAAAPTTLAPTSAAPTTGGDDAEPTDSVADTSVDTTGATPATEPESTDTESTDTESTDTDSTDPDSTEPEATDPEGTEPDTTDTDAEPALEKPTVELPDEVPTELVITDLIEGTGDEAAEGDTVVVHYVGVRSEDGVEFDNSYDGGSPFPVTLGAGGVIAGWEQGLVGVKQGGRRQLDIPSDLAYGESGAGEDIPPDTAISFVIDVLAIVTPEQPEIEIEPTDNVTEVAFEDLVVGDGEEISAGASALVHLIAARADTGEILLSSWEGGQPETLVYDEAGLLPGLYEGMAGMKVGGRRLISIPYEAPFGSEGDEGLGLPPEVDLIVVVDLFGAF